MKRLNGSLRLADQPLRRLDVVVDLAEDRMEIRSGDDLIGSWAFGDIGVRGEDDGFHLFVEGEELILTTDDDPGFALGIGLHSASPILRRRISAALHEPERTP